MADRARLEPRLASLDVMRGVTVVGMIVVNTAAYLKALGGGYDAWPALLHSEWAGFTAADAVFPAFIFMAGVSIPLAMRDQNGLDPRQAGRVGARTLRLVLWGLLISNLYFLADPAANPFRPMGVLQRIGLCYGAGALLYLAAGWRARAVLAAGLLLAYWPLCLLPSPDGTPSDLHLAGADFVAWFDRAVLGGHAFVRGPLGFDPEGLLSTLPAIAQCLLGVLAGERLLGRKTDTATSLRLAVAGATLLVLGLGWSLAFPPVKAIWTSSYVLVSSGAALVVLSACHWLFDVKDQRGPVALFFTAFGLNAIFAYVLHELASIAVAGQWMRVPFYLALPCAGPQVATLLCVAIFVAMIWLAVEYLRRRGWVIKV
jgi:predicted acyltransferase